MQKRREVNTGVGLVACLLTVAGRSRSCSLKQGETASAVGFLRYTWKPDEDSIVAPREMVRTELIGIHHFLRYRSSKVSRARERARFEVSNEFPVSERA